MAEADHALDLFPKDRVRLWDVGGVILDGHRSATQLSGEGREGKALDWSFFMVVFGLDKWRKVTRVERYNRLNTER